MTGNLYLVGFMGSGKTTVGQRLASLLRRRFVDMDARLASRLGMPIRDAFGRQGEARFRDAEGRLLREISRRSHLVVATGGGVPERRENRDLMHHSGKIVSLEATLEGCMERLSPQGQADRPLWTDPGSLKRLLERRAPLYRDRDLSVAVEGRGPDEIAQAIVAALLPDRRIPWVPEDRECPVIATWQTAEALSELVRGRKILLLTDARVAHLHLPRFSEALGRPPTLVIPPGERSKSLAGARRVYEALLGHRMERGDLLVSVGGGVVTDLGAFVAATYKRGMGSVLVSTTLLGCVDAAVGGKAAVNLGRTKNLVGAFTLPEAVLLDVASLGTLSRRSLADGLVEAYKTGLVASPWLAQLVERDLTALLAGDLPSLHELVSQAAEAKLQVVSRDFREGGVRQILNFGHTFGHVLEGWGRFRTSHGAAVGAGMIVATGLSRTRGLIPDDLAKRITDTVAKILKRMPQCPALEEAWPLMKNDKKVRGGRVVFVLLQGVGEPLVLEDVSREEFARALESLGEV